MTVGVTSLPKVLFSTPSFLATSLVSSVSCTSYYPGKMLEPKAQEGPSRARESSTIENKKSDKSRLFAPKTSALEITDIIHFW